MLDKKFWAKYFEVYDTLNEFIPYQELIEDVIEALNVEKGDKVLDAGSGTGNLSMRLEKLGAHVVALDFSEEGQRIHKRKNPKQTEFVLADLIKTLPFKDESFDKVVSVNTLYAIPEKDRKNVIKEFYRVLRKEGGCFLVNPLQNKKIHKIFINHFKKDFKKRGFIKTLVRTLRFFKLIIYMSWYNFLIKKESLYGHTTFFSYGKKKKLLKSAGFNELKSKKVYAKQSILIEARK